MICDPGHFVGSPYYVLDNPCMIIETANELGNQCNIAGLNAVSNNILASIDANLNSTYCTNYGKKIMLFTDSLQDIQLALMHPEYTCSLAMAIPVSSCYSDKALDLTVAESMFNDEVCDITKVINRPNLEKIIGCKSTYNLDPLNQYRVSQINHFVLRV